MFCYIHARTSWFRCIIIPSIGKCSCHDHVHWCFEKMRSVEIVDSSERERVWCLPYICRLPVHFVPLNWTTYQKMLPPGHWRECSLLQPLWPTPSPIAMTRWTPTLKKVWHTWTMLRKKLLISFIYTSVNYTRVLIKDVSLDNIVTWYSVSVSEWILEYSVTAQK